MSEKPRVFLCLALHNHQPVGNFDHVFQQAYEDSYRPFLDVFQKFDSLRMALHISGPLLEWLDSHHPEYLDRVAELVQGERIEILGGAYYEPILTMIPSRDRIGQIREYSQHVASRLGAAARGMWVPERVWEQSLTKDLVAAGIDYTILDDFHFKNAGWIDDQLYGYYVTEDEGQVLRVFPGSERLRYTIPFADPVETIRYCEQVAQGGVDRVLVFGDDGEKLGAWPHTRKHVYDDGWLVRFFTLLAENAHWLVTTTPGEMIDRLGPVGKIYLPEGSYREMTEWALPVARQRQYEQLASQFHDDPRWAALRSFMRGGCWRNFKVKYTETNEMYARMLMVSRRVQSFSERGADPTELDRARKLLYRGQCNCSYWHGAFGGTYLPHLRNAVYRHLICADNLLDQLDGKRDVWVEATADDYNLDGRPELRLASDQFLCLIAPFGGGHLYEWDIRPVAHNLLATLDRRDEVYHDAILRGPSAGGHVATINVDRIAKQEGLRERVCYDAWPRKSLVDHFYAGPVTPERLLRGQVEELGDFVRGNYDAKLRKSPQRVQAQLARAGHVGPHRIMLTKALTIEAGSASVEVAYLLDNLPPGVPILFGFELNFAGLPAGPDDRFFHLGQQRLGHLGSKLTLDSVPQLGLADEWLGIDVRLVPSQPTSFWTFPIETVSQSEGGFELVHQSVIVHPHWLVQGDAEGRWSVTLRMEVRTRSHIERSSESWRPAEAVPAKCGT